MRITNLVATLALMVLPAMVRAGSFNCTKDNVTELTDTQLQQLLNITSTVLHIMDAKVQSLTELENANNGNWSSLMEPVAPVTSSPAYYDILEGEKVRCKGAQKCVRIDNSIDCFDEKTSILYMAGVVSSLNILNGDVYLPYSAKANAFTNTKPIEDYIQSIYDQRKGFSGDKETDKADKTTEAGMEKASATPGSTTDKKESKKDDDKDSAAGRLIVGWVVGVVALGAFVVV